MPHTHIQQSIAPELDQDLFLARNQPASEVVFYLLYTRCCPEEAEKVCLRKVPLDAAHDDLAIHAAIPTPCSRPDALTD